MPPRLYHSALLACASMSFVGLAACGGFSPMYADASLNESLAGVAVEAPSHSRTGYLIRQAIDDELGRNRGDAPRYRVLLDLDEHRAPRGVRVNNVAGRYEISLVTKYAMVDAASGAPLISGAFVTQVSYDSADAPYAGLAASQEGEERVAQQAAVRLRLELSRYLNGHPYHAAPTAAGAQDRYQSKAGSRPLDTDTGNLDSPRDDLSAEPRSPNAPASETPASPVSPRDPI